MRKRQSWQLWTAQAQNRLIEMYRTRHTLAEIARELSLPLDEIERRIERLSLDTDIPRDHF